MAEIKKMHYVDKGLLNKGPVQYSEENWPLCLPVAVCAEGNTTIVPMYFAQTKMCKNCKAQ